jgi:CRISPR-associated protein Cas1
LRISVDGRHLVVEDGFASHRRRRRFARGTHGISRLVIDGASGSLSLEVLRWCAGAGVQITVLDPSDGSVLATSATGFADDGRIRRAQALAMGTETGLEIARFLISTKLAGQRGIAHEQLERSDVAGTIDSLAAMVADAESLEEIRQLEAAAANVYWSAWESSVELRFIRRDEARGRIPESWHRFCGRRSAVNPGTARNATDPANALLNLSYHLVAAECRLALIALDLDPSLGVLHADMRGREGLTYDLAEACRPVADAHVLRLIREHTFASGSFGLSPKGVVRVLQPLLSRVQEAAPSYGSAIAPAAEKIRDLLAAASPYDVDTPSILTRTKHRAAARKRADAARPAETPVGAGPGVIGVVPRKSPRQRPRDPGVHPTLPFPVCRMCGVQLTSEPDRQGTRARLCPSCTPARRAEIGAMIQAVPKARRPISPETTAKRVAANRARRLAELEWERDHAGEVPDREWYLQAVLPGIRGLSLTTIARAVGVSTATASRIRAGRSPHPRWWKALEALGSETT